MLFRSISVLTLCIGIGLGYTIFKVQSEPVENITELSRGTYISDNDLDKDGNFDNPDQQYDYVLTIETKKNEFILYENSKQIDRGIAKFIGNNTIELAGKTTYTLLYERGEYIMMVDTGNYKGRLDFIRVDNTPTYYGNK